jgi:hypothetical protein
MTSQFQNGVIPFLRAGLSGRMVNRVAVFRQGHNCPSIAGAMLDQIVDSFVTPQGLVDLLRKEPDSKGDGITINRTGFTDFDEYTIELGQAVADPAKTIRAVLRRQVIIWRVVRAGFPSGKAPWETAEPTGLGLKIQKLAPARTLDGLIIEGDVLNTGETPREIPRLRLRCETPQRRRFNSRS